MSPVTVAPLGEYGLRINLNRPDQANAISDELTDALLAALTGAVEAGTRMVVLEGNGKNFCGGFDFTGVEERSEGDLLLRFVRIEQALQLLWNGPFVSVACAQGAAFGAGADLVAASTYRVGAPGGRFRFPGYRFGIALGTRRLAQVVGVQRARDILLTNALIDTDAAFEAGLLMHRVEREGWEDFVSGLSDGLSGLTNVALADLLANLRSGRDTDDKDLANLVRSAARPGIHQRIAAYRAAAPGSRKV